MDNFETSDIPFGYLLRFQSRTFWAILISIPLKVNPDRTRWKINRHMSLIDLRIPSCSGSEIRTQVQNLNIKLPFEMDGSSESDDQPPHLFRYASAVIRSPLYPKSSTMARIFPGIKLRMR